MADQSDDTNETLSAAETATGGGKTCPECGAKVRQAAALCKECGYLFAAGRHGRAGTPLETAAAVDQVVNPGDSRRELLRLARPIILLCLVVAAVSLFVWQNRARETWYDDLNAMSPAQTQFDRRFQGRLLLDYRGVATGADVRAADGLCLINIDTDDKPSGVMARLGGKLAATAMACAYADGRRMAGEGRSARVVIYINRRRHSSGDCRR